MTMTMIGLDTAKTVFQVHGIDESGKAVLKRKLHRSELVAFFAQQPRCTVFLEACGAGHHWARLLGGLGHEVKLIAPEAVRPFVGRGNKNDAADAAALCVAGSRPETRFVPVKSVEQQAVLALHAARSLLVVRRRQMVPSLWPAVASSRGRRHPPGGNLLSASDHYLALHDRERTTDRWLGAKASGSGGPRRGRPRGPTGSWCAGCHAAPVRGVGCWRWSSGA